MTVYGDVVTGLQSLLPVGLPAVMRSRPAADGVGRMSLALNDASPFYASMKIVLSGAFVPPVPTSLENSLDEFFAEATWNFDCAFYQAIVVYAQTRDRLVHHRIIDR